LVKWNVTGSYFINNKQASFILMNLKQKIWLMLTVVIGIVVSVDAVLMYQRFENEIAKENRTDAETVYAYMMATRRIYQKQFIESELPINSKTVGFLPAHSMNRISDDFKNWNSSGMTFKNVSDRPRNPSNQADRHEMEDIAWYRENPEEKERVRLIELESGQSVNQFTSPIWVEKFCLNCHDRPERSPQGITAMYPDDPAYGYQVGDLRGLISIRIPSQRLQSRLKEMWIKHMIHSLSGYLLLLVVLGYLLERLVSKRLSVLQSSVHQFASGEYAERIHISGTDEICELANSFNYMANEIEKRSIDLIKLSSAVEQSPASILITDRQAKIEYVNTTFEVTTGYMADEVLGKTPKFLKSGFTNEKIYKKLWPALARGEIWYGEFINRRKDGSLYTDETVISPIRDQQGEITHYLAVQQDVTEKKQTQEKIHRPAYFDDLTGLPNRTHLSQRLDELLTETNRNRQTNALILLNIDRFTKINDARGHVAGDIVLKRLAECLGSLKRNEDILAYLSGDEFALVIADVGDDADKANRSILVISDKIHNALLRPLNTGEEKVTITVSMGVTFFPNDEHETANDVVRLADTALHKAKEKGGKTTFFYEQEMGERARLRFQIEAELREAIKKFQLQLYLQSQVDKSGSIVSAEVLVRWPHPDKGMIPPAMFIPIAEESELIVAMSDWIFTRACQIIARQSMEGRSLRLSVNISPRHFEQEGFVTWIKEVLDKTGADPALITLEVTEGLMFTNIVDAIGKMDELVSMGIHFSVDDFGTGYSALSYLKRLPVSEIKIDKIFVQDAPSSPDDAVLVETILSVSKHMGLTVVAEGVETQEQADFLNQRAEVILQGYLYGKPEPAETWLENWQKTE
jgi:diguanylate cyclase (GGDEF)-like protein/PAS domain S-box-containing protein